MFDHKEAIEELEGQRGHGEEIHGDDHLAMILQETEPAFGWIGLPRSHASQISGDGAFGDLKT